MSGSNTSPAQQTTIRIALGQAPSGRRYSQGPLAHMAILPLRSGSSSVQFTQQCTEAETSPRIRTEAPGVHVCGGTWTGQLTLGRGTAAASRGFIVQKRTHARTGRAADAKAAMQHTHAAAQCCRVLGTCRSAEPAARKDMRGHSKACVCCMHLQYRHDECTRTVQNTGATKQTVDVFMQFDSSSPEEYFTFGGHE